MPDGGASGLVAMGTTPARPLQTKECDMTKEVINEKRREFLGTSALGA